MEKFVPREKMSKKARRQLDLAARKTWGSLNPVTRSGKNAKVYKRKRIRQEDGDDPSAGCV